MTDLQQHSQAEKWIKGAPTWKHFNVRCPCCDKLYRIETAQIISASPHFACKVCHAVFSFNKPTSETRFVKAQVVSAARLHQITEVSELHAESSHLFKCKKCGSWNTKNATDCVKCGVNFSRLEESFDPLTEMKVMPSLVRAWSELVQDFNNLQKHISFVSRCEELQALPFALKRYEMLREIQPQDRIADQMWKHVMLKAQGLQAVQKISGVHQRLPWATLRKCAPFVLVGLCVFFGLLESQNRNLLGVAAALLFLIVGSRAFQKKQSS